MKKMRYRVVLFFVLFICIGEHIAAATDLPVVTESFAIGFEQNGQFLPVKEHQIILEKKSFTVVVFFRQPDDILVNASLTPESFNLAQSGAALADIPGFANLGMAEESFNPRTLLMLSKDSPHYWYYADENDHRFNDVIVKNRQLICRRLITQVMQVEKKQLSIVKELPGNALYFVFLKTSWTKDFTKQIEQQRDYVKVIFQ
ncbi:hypothetical protein U14_05690 [Candidatus Moduliflexus flocculans]|uniref:Uncharacterized protein n=1 Tax=Candidatus Moduliflexus flocculans TaxID=1499966 RepID=A0A081BSM4_9BACT|nr:hypothetical protein U14_05690 [Candidatus Moduliflexus flocculans]